MSIDSGSLIARLGLFFALMLLVINLLLFFEHDYRSREANAAILRHCAHVSHQIRELDEDADLSLYMVRRSTFDAQTIRRDGTLLGSAPFGMLYRYHNGRYFVETPPPKPPFSDLFEPPHGPSYSRDALVLESLRPDTAISPWILIGGANFLMLLFFTYFIRKLLPLRRLETAIGKLDTRETPQPLSIEGRDEIARIAVAYNRVRERLYEMQEARTLFLRNILHEFKTPLMKGHLLGAYIDDTSLKARFETLFGRMEYILGALGRIEQLSSGSWELNAHPYRLGDLFDHAYDLLLRDDTRIHPLGDRNVMIEADFEYFAVALKNLLDNALRHGEGDVSVTLEEMGISVCSYGPELTFLPAEFSRPFNRSYEGGGLGLGLYITQTIAAKHGYRLRYFRSGEQNCFRIEFEKDAA